MSGRTFTGNQGMHSQSSIKTGYSDPAAAPAHAPAFATQAPGARVNMMDALRSANAQLVGNRNVTTQSGSRSIYAALGAKNANDWSDVLGNVDIQTEEQARQDALDSAAQLGVMAQQQIMRRQTNSPMFQAFKAGVERLRHPSERNPNLVDEVGGRFIDMALSNPTIYGIMVSNTIIQMVGLTAQSILDGDQSDRQKRTFRFVVDAASTAATYELIEYLAHTPDGLEQYHNLTKQIRDVITRCEENHDRAAAIFALSDTQCPWGRTTMKDALSRYNQSNPMLDFNNHFSAMVNPDPRSNPVDYAINTYMGLNKEYVGGGPIFTTPEQATQGVSPEVRELIEWNARAARKYRENNVPGYSSENNFRRQVDEGELTPIFDHNGFDRQIPPFTEYTRERRHHYNMSDYFKPVGDTGWLIGNLEESIRLLTFSYSKQAQRNGILQREEVLPNSALKVLLVKINDDGSVNYRHVKVGREMVGVIQEKSWTNPDTVLPYMWEEEGVVRTSWTPRVETTEERIQDGKVVALGKMKELEKEPNLVITSKAITPATDREMHNRIEAAMKLYDPKSELDAFIAPVTLNRPYTLQDNISSRYMYNSLSMLVKGSEIDYQESTVAFLKDVSNSLGSIVDQNLVSFIRTQMTVAANRWLVEVRGYSETKPENGTYWVKFDDLFDDLKQFVNDMSNNDPEGLSAFLYLTNDHPLLDAWQFLLPEEEVKEHFLTGVDKEDPVVVLEAESIVKRTLMFSRDVVVVKLRNEVGSLRDDLIVSMESEDPKLHTIISKALQYGRKHFKTEPTVLIDYGSPANTKIRAVGFSGFDRSCIRLRAISELGELCLLTPAIY